MKTNLLPALKLTVLCIVLLMIVYPMAVWGIAQFSSNSGKGQIVTHKGKEYYLNIGQKFTDDKYFWSRPSSVDFNAAGSGGSNKAPSNEEYLIVVQARIDSFLVHNIEVSKDEIPVDLVTASGSGLDPHISVQAAKVQVKRIARVRGVEESALRQLVLANTERPLFGIFGPEKINVLRLNIALDNMK